MLEAISGAELPSAHVGLHAGPTVVFQGGDYFGRTVNIAARIADHAGPGQILASQEIVNSTDNADVAFTAIGPVALKGVSSLSSSSQRSEGPDRSCLREAGPTRRRSVDSLQRADATCTWNIVSACCCGSIMSDPAAPTWDCQ